MAKHLVRKNDQESPEARLTVIGWLSRGEQKGRGFDPVRKLRGSMGEGRRDSRAHTSVRTIGLTPLSFLGVGSEM